MITIDKGQRYEAYVWKDSDGTTQGRPIINQQPEREADNYPVPRVETGGVLGTLYLDGHSIAHGNGDRPLPQYDYRSLRRGCKRIKTLGGGNMRKRRIRITLYQCARCVLQ